MRKLLIVVFGITLAVKILAQTSDLIIIFPHSLTGDKPREPLIVALRTFDTLFSAKEVGLNKRLIHNGYAFVHVFDSALYCKIDSIFYLNLPLRKQMGDMSPNMYVYYNMYKDNFLINRVRTLVYREETNEYFDKLIEKIEKLGYETSGLVKDLRYVSHRCGPYH